MMTAVPDLPVCTILAQVFVDRIAWVISRDGAMIGHGRVGTFEELRGVQVRAGVLEVILHRAGKGFELPRSLTYRGEWRVANDLERENLDNFFSLIYGGFADEREGVISTGGESA